MKPPRFGYHDPETVGEVVQLLGTLENNKLLAGGQSLMAMLNMRYLLPDHLIDLNRVTALDYLRESGGSLQIGAMTRQSDMEFSALIRKNCPLMDEALPHIGHRQTRNRGTLGGSLCQLDPSAELVTVAAALDANVTICGPQGERNVAFADFPLGYMTPAVEPDELLTGVQFPIWKAGHGYAFVEFARRHGDYAVVSAAALLEENAEGKVTRVALALGGATAVPLRMTAIEQALLGNTVSESLLRELCETCREIDAMADVHSPASYRRQLATSLSRRALLLAHERAVAARRTPPLAKDGNQSGENRS